MKLTKESYPLGTVRHSPQRDTIELPPEWSTDYQGAGPLFPWRPLRRRDRKRYMGLLTMALFIAVLLLSNEALR